MMSQSSLIELTAVKKVTATHEAITIKSPGHEEQELKDQDRLWFTEESDRDNSVCQYAIVCDGATTSPYSAVAASYVASRGSDLFESDGIRRAVTYLNRQRAALLEKPLKLDEEHSPALRSMLEEIVRQKYQSSYQTTFVAVRLQSGAAGQVLIKVIGCGDSAVFIFEEGGQYLDNNVGIVSALDEFQHGSPFTAVLPDSYDEETDYVLFDRSCAAPVNVLLCSDGFYDSFTNFKEMRDWLNEHREHLHAAGAEHQCLADLHARLTQRKGDDDISFIWLHPPRKQPSANSERNETDDEAADETDHNREPVKDGRRRTFFGFFRIMLRRFRFKTG